MVSFSIGRGSRHCVVAAYYAGDHLLRGIPWTIDRHHGCHSRALKPPHGVCSERTVLPHARSHRRLCKLKNDRIQEDEPSFALHISRSPISKGSSIDTSHRSRATASENSQQCRLLADCVA